MSEQRRSVRLPRQGEIWHPSDDPEDCVIVTGTNGNIVFYQAPPDSGRGRNVPWNTSTNLDDFTRYLIPQEQPVSGQQVAEPDLNVGTRGDYPHWVIETRLGGIPVCAWRTPYPEDARQRLGVLRTVHPELTFCAVRQITTRTEEAW